MIIWLSINTMLIACLGFILYLVVRQIGVMLNRLGPVGARTTADYAPRVGENISFFMDQLKSTKEVTNLPSLYIFGSETCPICAAIKKDAEKLILHWREIVDFFIIYDGNNPEKNKFQKLSSGIFFSEHQLVRNQVGVNTVPFAVITNEKGVVLGRGLVNEISHLESLLEMIIVK